jgi:hypothetical protein
MKRPCRNYSSDFKAKVALAAVRGELPLAQLTEKYEYVPPRVRSGSPIFSKALRLSLTARSRTSLTLMCCGCTPKSANLLWLTIF